MAQPDWSKAGKRLRFGPKQHGRNPDWNDRLSRWKVAEEYASEDMSAADVEAAVQCPVRGCEATAGTPCDDVRGAPMPGSPHPERVFAAGAARIAAGWKL
jgi:hypothetical protein